MPTSETKLCTKCGPERGPLPLDDFEITRTNPDTGVAYRAGRCRECRNAERRETSRAWYARNADHQIARVLACEATGGKARKPAHMPKGPESPVEIRLTAREWVALNAWGAGPSDALRRLLIAASEKGLKP